MPKKRPADERDGARASKLRSRQRKHHLYLVLDGWEKGYSIRKFDLSSDSDDSDDDGDLCPASMTTERERRLPPSLFRLEAPHARSGLFAAFGTKIVATHHTPRRSALMFDVRTRSLTFGLRHKYEPNCYGNDYVQVDGTLFVLDVDGNFETLEPPPPTPSDEHAYAYVEIVWKWEKLPKPPFVCDNVASHAVHPDERTIFFSTERETEKLTTKVATFSFDTVSRKWTRHGEWLLPFKGRGYFDPELDAWIGLSSDPDNLGYLCACELVPADESNGEAPLLKVGLDKMFCVDPAEKHIGATLVYMWGRSKFCLVECLSVDDRKEEFWGEFLSERLRYFLRVTTFFLKYDKNGDLRTAVHHQRVRSYRLPKMATGYCDHLEKPVAFWM